MTVVNHSTCIQSVNVTVYANATTIKTQPIILESDIPTTIILVWNTIDFVKGRYTISANVTGVFGETDVDNNSLVLGLVLVTIPGDITGDFLVNIKDASIIGVNWQKHT